MNDPALLALLPLEAQVIEVAGVPQGVKVAFQRRLIVDIACTGKDVGANGVLGDAAVAMNLDVFDQVLLGGGRQRPSRDTHTEQQAGQEAGHVFELRRSPPPVTPMPRAGVPGILEFWASAPGQRWHRTVVGTQNAATSVACSLESCHSIRSSVAQAKGACLCPDSNRKSTTGFTTVRCRLGSQNWNPELRRKFCALFSGAAADIRRKLFQIVRAGGFWLPGVGAGSTSTRAE